MDIKALIRQEASGSDTHDMAYRKALGQAYEIYRKMELKELLECQKSARVTYDSSHKSTASCMVLYELIREASEKI